MTRFITEHRRSCIAAALLLVMLAGILSLCLAKTTPVWPATGKKSGKNGGMTVDYSNCASGYIMVKAPSSKKKLKLRIKKGDEYYNYDISSDDGYVVFPLQMGSGSYTVLLYENKSGNKYAQKGKVTFSAKLSSEYAPFLCPSQYVWYTEKSPAVAKSNELCEGLKTDAEKLQAIRSYMKSNFVYDYIRSITQRDAYLADVDGVFESKTGLCQDFAAIMACMLRVQGIPTQMAIGQVTGNLGTISHAWNYVLIDGKYERVDITAEISGSNNSQYTVEKTY